MYLRLCVHVHGGELMGGREGARFLWLPRSPHSFVLLVHLSFLWCINLSFFLWLPRSPHSFVLLVH